MLCAEFEIRLCDYLDGTLEAASRRELEQHASGCRSCAALLADSAVATEFLSRAEAVEAPRELVTHILHRTQQARGAFGAAGWRSWFRPLLQPRFAMSMAMTVLSISMLYQVAGGNLRQLQAADLNPVNVWRGIDNGAHRLWNRGVKYYQNLRWVYEVMSMLRSLDDEAEQEPARDAGQARPEPKKIEP